MDTGIATEILIWAAQVSQNHHQNHPLSSLVSYSPSISNIILFAYVAAVVVNRKARFIAAFLICDIMGNLYNYSSPTGYEIYLGYAFIYSLLYWSLTVSNARLKTRLACAIIVLFDARMTLHALFYGSYEALIYVYYEYITLLVHLCLIATLFSWKRIRRSLVDSCRAIYRKFRYSDHVAYICYNFNTQTNQTAKK